MDLRSLLLTEHALIHSAEVAKANETQLAEVIWIRLNEEQKRECLPGHNSVAWILWHLARWEDVHVNCLIRDSAEVLDEAWLTEMGIASRDAGTGATEEEVADFSARIDLSTLKGYRDAVGRETRSWLQRADLDSFNSVVDVAVRSSRAPAFIDRERAGWVLTEEKRSMASLWSWPVIGHAFAHLGDASHVMRSLGLQGR